MKKLMIGAAAAAMAVTSFGELCIEDTVAEGCAVYNVKFSFKTLAAKKDSKCGLTWLVDAALQGVWTRTDLDGKTITDDTVKAGNRHDQTAFPRVCAAKLNLYWMDNATRKFEGVLWQCEANCFEGAWFKNAGLQGNARINCSIWEKASKTSVTIPVLRYYTKKDKTQYSWFTGDYQNTFRFLGRYGQKATKVAAYWDLTNVLVGGQGISAAGFGSFNGKGFVKSISGNAVGMLRPLNSEKDVCGRRNFFVQIAPMCEDFIQWCCDGCYVAVELVPASGTWSIKYNSSLSKGKKSLAKILPDYAVFGPKAFASSTQWNRVQAYVNGLSAAAFLENNGIFYIAPLYKAASEEDCTEDFDPDCADLEGQLGQLFAWTYQAVENEYFADVENEGYDPYTDEQWKIAEDLD